jgi:hypothetical protein
MIQSTPDLHCQHHVPQQLSVAGVIFGEDYLLELALTSGFYQRSPRKIDACSMLAAICSSKIKTLSSYAEKKTKKSILKRSPPLT